MKKLHLLYLVFIALILPLSSEAVMIVDGKTAPQAAQINLADLSVEEFLALSPKDLKTTGKKAKLADRVALRMAQRQVKKAQKKGIDLNAADAYEDARGNFSIGGFLLGFILGPIGVLISLLFGAGAFRSSLIGLLCSVLVWVIVLVF